MKKALALILCLVMLLGVFPMSAAFAEGETEKLPEANAASVGEGEILYLTEKTNTATLQEAQATEGVATASIKAVSDARIENAMYVIVDYAEMISNDALLKKVKEMVAGGKYVFIRANGQEATRETIFKLMDTEPSLVMEDSEFDAVKAQYQTFGYMIYMDKNKVQVVRNEFEEVSFLNSEEFPMSKEALRTEPLTNETREFMKETLQKIEPASFESVVNATKSFVVNREPEKQTSDSTMGIADQFDNWDYVTETAFTKHYRNPEDGVEYGHITTTGFAVEVNPAQPTSSSVGGSQWIFAIETTMVAGKVGSLGFKSTNSSLDVFFYSYYEQPYDFYNGLTYHKHINQVRPIEAWSGQEDVTFNFSSTPGVQWKTSYKDVIIQNDLQQNHENKNLDYGEVLLQFNPQLANFNVTWQAAIKELNQVPEAAAIRVSILPSWRVQNGIGIDFDGARDPQTFNIVAGESTKWTPTFHTYNKGTFKCKSQPSAKVYQSWTTKSDTIGSISYKNPVVVVGATGKTKHDWAKVNLNGTIGYVKSSKIDWNSPVTGGGSSSNEYKYVTNSNVSSYLNIRSTPAASGNTIVGKLYPTGYVIGYDYNSEWVYVKILKSNGSSSEVACTGYAKKSYLTQVTNNGGGSSSSNTLPKMSDSQYGYCLFHGGINGDSSTYNIQCYSDSACTKKDGKIYYSDTNCKILTLTSSYAYVQYPITGGTKTRYVKTSDLLGSLSRVGKATAKKNIYLTVANVKSGTTGGSIASGDTVWIFSKTQTINSVNYTRIIYPVTNSSNQILYFKLGWIKTNDLTSVN